MHSKIEEFRHKNWRFIKGCIILYIVHIFSSSELVASNIHVLVISFTNLNFIVVFEVVKRC